jgi:hypothetical protein
VLHPQRSILLFRRAGWILRMLSVALLLLALVGAALLIVPFSVILPNPDPPPFEVEASCPPPPLAALAGRAGLTGPLDGSGEIDAGLDALSPAAAHDAGCLTFGRRRAITGSLLLAAGYVNAAALLEAGRTFRRARRRRRRAQRARHRADARARSTGEHPPGQAPTNER